MNFDSTIRENKTFYSLTPLRAMIHLLKPITLSMTGHIHNLNALRSQLQTSETDPATLIKLGWLQWGEALAEYLMGDFALVIRDDQRHISYAARDRVGVKPLYYRVDSGQLSHGFSVPELRAKCPLAVSKDLDWAAAYMVSQSFSPTTTGYKEIKKLAPGSCLTCDAEGRVHIWRYHEWRDDAPFTTQRDPQWVQGYRDIFEESIRCRMDTTAPMGTENSGGLDSGAITAYLAHFLGEPGDRLWSFSYAMLEEEPSYILRTSQALRVRHNYVLTDMSWPAQSSISQGLSILGYPEEHGNAVGHTVFYKKCQRLGIQALFSGFGGDEVGTNPGNLLRWELLDQHAYGALMGIMKGGALARMARTLKAASLGRGKPSTHREGLHQAMMQRWPRHWLRQEVVEDLNLLAIYEARSAFDAPFRRINDFILGQHLNPMHYVARLENCSVAAAAYGVDYRWPLWDARLVQQYLSTPSIEKLGPQNTGRYLHRRAVDGVTPKEVAWKSDKSMGDRVAPKVQSQAQRDSLQQRTERVLHELHPSLDSVIDRKRVQKQLDHIKQDTATDLNFQFMFERSLRSLEWLNAWYHTA
jgi:asparagine synthase (glutamine-hydrolysing)